MKLCDTCKILKPIDDFHKRKVARDGHSSRCKQCQKEYQQKHYAKNKKRIYDNNINRRKRLAEEVNKLKDFPCIDCGQKYEPFCMDFDHVSDKVMNVSKMVHETFSLKKIKEEIAKCELVCILCHRDRTYKRLLEQERAECWPCYDRNRAIIRLAKSCPCSICNIQYEWWQMDFDHLQDKDIAVGLMQGCAEKRILQEIDKCQVLCALCHRRKTQSEIEKKKNK